MVESLPLTLSMTTLPSRWSCRHSGLVSAGNPTLIGACNGYPAHLQLFAHAAWREAPGSDRVELVAVQRALPRAVEPISLRTLGPRWEQMPDRQMERLAALAVNGGEATSRQLASTLSRSQRELSWIREALIEEGDIYSPRRGHIRMAVLLFAPYVLSEYENARQDSAAPESMLTLMAMRTSAALTSGLLQARALRAMSRGDRI